MTDLAPPTRTVAGNWLAFAAVFLACGYAAYIDASTLADVADISRWYAANILLSVVAWLMLLPCAWIGAGAWRWLMLLTLPLMALYATRATLALWTSFQ